MSSLEDQFRHLRPTIIVTQNPEWYWLVQYIPPHWVAWKMNWGREYTGEKWTCHSLAEVVDVLAAERAKE